MLNLFYSVHLLQNKSYLVVTFLLHSIGIVFQDAKGKPPVVGYIPFGVAPWLNVLVGGPNYPSVRPFPSAPIATLESLWKRTWNVLHYITDDLMRQFYYLPNMQRIAEEYVGHEMRPLHEIEKNINIVLINSHPSFEPAIPLPPNTLEVAGLNAQAMQPIAGETVVKYPEVREIVFLI